MSDPAFDVIAHLIEISVAPVFLLVAVGSFLNVATQRLARVVDRARAIEDQALSGALADKASLAELATLDKRITYANRAIMLSSVSALLVAIDVAVLFVGGLTGADVWIPVAILFIAAMAGVISGLGFFLAEISVATRTLRVRASLISRSADLEE